MSQFLRLGLFIGDGGSGLGAGTLLVVVGVNALCNIFLAARRASAWSLSTVKAEVWCITGGCDCLLFLTNYSSISSSGISSISSSCRVQYSVPEHTGHM